MYKAKWLGFSAGVPGKVVTPSSPTYCLSPPPPHPFLTTSFMATPAKWNCIWNCNWRDFLSSWNGISFFCDDHITQPEDIQLYTDATPSIGFRGHYGGRLFTSDWPPERFSLSPSSPCTNCAPLSSLSFFGGTNGPKSYLHPLGQPHCHQYHKQRTFTFIGHHEIHP